MDRLRELYGDQCLDPGQFGYKTRISAVNPPMIDDLGDQTLVFTEADILRGSCVSNLCISIR